MTMLLVVDDNPQNVEVLKDCLADENYQVRSANSGVDALRIAVEQTPDCVLLDVAMPDIDGLEVCRRLKAASQTRAIPVIMISALDAAADIVSGLDTGADDYITKPFDSRIVRARVRAVLRVAEAQQATGCAMDLLSQANQELDSKNQQLAKHNQTAHAFVDHVSHELRSPLQVVRDYTSIVNDELVGPVTEQQQEFLQIVLSSIDDLVLMADDMLDTSRMEAGLLTVRRRTTTVREIIQQVRPMLERLASSAGVVLNVQLTESLPEVFCDSEKAGRVLINLVANSAKFSGSGSQITLGAVTRNDGSSVTLSIKDNGPGIGSNQLDIIFERFSQVGNNLRASALGVGLGLNIAQELVRLNLGEITVESQLGEGSTFSFTLPSSNLHSLLDQHLAYTRQLDKTDSICYLLTRLSKEGEENVFADVYEFLVHNLRNADLVVPLAAGRWLLAISAADRPVETIIQRIGEGWQKHYLRSKHNNLLDLEFQWLKNSLQEGEIVPHIAQLCEEESFSPSISLV